MTVALGKSKVVGLTATGVPFYRAAGGVLNLLCAQDSVSVSQSSVEDSLSSASQQIKKHDIQPFFFLEHR